MKNVVKVFVKNDRLGKYLFQLRDNNPAITNPNTYGLLGGNFEDNEKPIEALVRELKEEINISVDNIQELGDTVLESVLGAGIEKSKTTLFLAQTNADLKDIQLSEGQGCEYFTIDEALHLPNLSLPTREAIREYRYKFLP